jgi:hypothetical protein
VYNAFYLPEKEILIGVDETKPESTYKGHDRQEWQILHRKAQESKNPPQKPTPILFDFGTTIAPPPVSLPTRNKNEFEEQVIRPGIGPDHVTRRTDDEHRGRSGSQGQFGETLGNVADWVLEHIPLFNWLIDKGEGLAEVDWKLRLPLAAICAIVAVGLITSSANQLPAWPHASEGLHYIAGDYAPALALALGGVAGWFLPTVVGILLAISAWFGALVTGLALIALGAILAYGIVAAIAGWPPFVPHGPTSTVTRPSK